MAKSIVIEFDENGDCSIEAQGFVGPACDKALSEIEKELGQTTQRTVAGERRSSVRRSQSDAGAPSPAWCVVVHSVYRRAAKP
ncbi:MAG: DUF2997 domain-containing protein [Planctomycetota bacterium]